MSRRKIKAGSTSISVPIFVQDTSSTTGAGLGSLVYNTSSLAARYRREGDSSWTSITLATMTLGTWASGGFITSSGVTGKYEFGVPNAALASGKTWCEIEIYGATNMLPVLLEFELDAVDYQDANSFGLSVFSGMTSLANWFRRFIRKDAGTANMAVAESEINTGGTATFSGQTDSLEAIRDRGDAAWITGSGAGGALTVPVHVSDDSTNDVVGKIVTVRLSGVLQDVSAATDADGNTTVSLNAGDNYEFIVPAGNGFTGSTTSVDVNDESTVELVVTAVSRTPSDPGETTCFAYVRDLSPNAPAVSPVTLKILKLAEGSVGKLFKRRQVTNTSAADGLVEFPGIPQGATCQVRVVGDTDANWATFVASYEAETEIVSELV